MTYVVGLTGGIGSGKSAVADLFAARGILVVDTDAVAHALTAPGGAAMPAIRAEFGAAVAAADDVIDNDGDLDALRPQIERLHVNYLAYARNVG